MSALHQDPRSRSETLASCGTRDPLLDKYTDDHQSSRAKAPRAGSASPKSASPDATVTQTRIPVVTPCGAASPISSTSIGSSHKMISWCEDIIVKHQ